MPKIPAIKAMEIPFTEYWFFQAIQRALRIRYIEKSRLNCPDQDMELMSCKTTEKIFQP